MIDIKKLENARMRIQRAKAVIFQTQNEVLKLAKDYMEKNKYLLMCTFPENVNSEEIFSLNFARVTFTDEVAGEIIIHLDKCSSFGEDWTYYVECPKLNFREIHPACISYPLRFEGNLILHFSGCCRTKEISMINFR